MEETRATFGFDLHVDLSGKPVRAGLEDALRDGARSGRLRPGTRLPSSRTLARDLGIARNTVADAFGQLVAEGWLVARRGSGTHVAERVDPIDAVSSLSVETAGRLPYDLRAGSPDLSAFPRAGWSAAARRALNRAPDEALGYSDPRGRPELRDALAEYLARARGVRVTPDRIVTCSGFTQGLGLLCQVLRARGASTLAIEAYIQSSHRELAAVALDLEPIAVDAFGATVAAIAGADAVLLTPAHQFPLGIALAAHRRTEVVAWAQDSGGLVIEDDYDGEFRYDRHPLGAVQALAPEHVVYAGTTSKSLAPALRLAWLVLPGHLVDDVVSAKRLTERQSSTLDELTLAEFLTTGAYDRHVRRQRLVYRRRRDRLVGALARHAPDAAITGIAAGLHALVELRPGEREDEVVARAARQGLAVEGLGPYRAGARSPARRPALVVGYGNPPEHAFTAAVARLCAVLNDTETGARDG